MFSVNPSLSEEDLQYLKTYKYKAGSYTALDTLLSDLSQKTVRFVPEWLSPNAITLIGFVLNLCGVAALELLKNEDGSASRCALFFCALTASMYIYMDMLDGKQARRLGCSSPLGQIFDHGCDSVSICCFTDSIIRAIGLEDYRLAGLMVAVVGFVFVTFQLIEYYQDVLMFGTSVCGVSEVEVSCVVVMLISAIFGTSVWSISLFGCTLRNCVVFFVVVMMGGAIFAKSVLILFQGGKTSEEDGNKNNSRLDHLKRYVPLLCGFLYSMRIRTMCFLTAYLSFSSIMRDYPHIVIGAFSV